MLPSDVCIHLLPVLTDTKGPGSVADMSKPLCSIALPSVNWNGKATHGSKHDETDLVKARL